MDNKANQQGVSLIQMLIGIAVAAFVLIMAGEMYYTIRHSYTRTVNTLLNNTKASVAAQALRNLIDQSSLPSPYGRWPWQQSDLRIANSTFNPLVYPSIYAATSLNFYNPSNHINGTDILMLQSVVSSELTTDFISANDTKMSIPTLLNITNNDYVLLADHAGYQVMKATAAASSGSIAVERGPARNYAAGSFLAQYHVYIFYLRELDGVRSLMVNIDQTSSQELMENIENFQIRYYANGSWYDVNADGNASHLNLWYKTVKGIEITYIISGKQYEMVIALKPNIL